MRCSTVKRRQLLELLTDGSRNEPHHKLDDDDDPIFTPHGDGCAQRTSVPVMSFLGATSSAQATLEGVIPTRSIRHTIGPMTPDLFDIFAPIQSTTEVMADGAMLLRGAALPYEKDILASLVDIITQSPFRRMVTPGGFTMSVAMTNCGIVGWVTDRTGYRYDRNDPEIGRPWPAMPGCFSDLAVLAATRAGHSDFRPDACLINRYEPGARLSLHQDKNERDFAKPIVSVSLGLPATFQFGGLMRNDPVKKFVLRHGNVAVWGGPSRLFYHGIPELKNGTHDSVGRMRISLTFRGAL